MNFKSPRMSWGTLEWQDEQEKGIVRSIHMSTIEVRCNMLAAQSSNTFAQYSRHALIMRGAECASISVALVDTSTRNCLSLQHALR